MGVCCFLIILISGLDFELKMADQQVSFDEFAMHSQLFIPYFPYQMNLECLIFYISFFL